MFSREEIAELIALVPQNPFLVAGTVFENICYGLEREVALHEAEDAARKANIYDFIASLPDGFDTLIAEGGGNLSGGQFGFKLQLMCQIIASIWFFGYYIPCKSLSP